MFKLLSKESNIFSIPLYIGFLLMTVIAFNFMNYSTLDAISGVITFSGTALGYFLFNKMDLNQQSHLPLFLYTFFVFALYPGNLDIGISVTLLTNSFLLLILTSENDQIRKNSYVLVGAILAINFLFLPTTWPMVIFVIFHIIGTSDKIGITILRLFFGMILIFMNYFGLMYFFGNDSWDSRYLLFESLKPMTRFYPLYWLAPILLLLLFSVFDHYRTYNKKSPRSKYKYGFLLLYTFAQLITVVLYMGKRTEYLLFLALPVTIILSRMLRFRTDYRVSEVGLWLIIFSLIIFKFATYFTNLNLLDI